MCGNVKKNCVNFLQRKGVADAGAVEKYKRFFTQNESEQ